jgi:hypothetical protein
MVNKVNISPEVVAGSAKGTLQKVTEATKKVFSPGTPGKGGV